MRSMRNSWWTQHHMWLFFLSALAIAFAMTACGKNKKDEKAKVKATVPVNVTQQNVNALVALASENSAQVSELVRTSGSANLNVTSTASFRIANLDPSGASTTDSQIYLTINVSSGSKSASARIQSNGADIRLYTQNELYVYGYWTMPRKSGATPAYVGINATVKRNSVSATDGYNLAGQIYSDLDANGSNENLAEFNDNLCGFVENVSFISAFAEDGEPDCSAYRD